MRGRSKRRGLVLAAALAATLGTGCIVYGGPTEGDIALLWSFEGGYSCLEAGVTDVLITVRGQDNDELYEVVMDCGQGGGTFTDFLEGNYTVHLEGLDIAGTVWYAHTRNVFVEAGVVVDLGRVILYSVVDPPPLTGSLQIDWAFFYPANEPTFDCAYAGVDYVQVAVTDAYGAPVFDQSVRCIDGPAIIDYFDPGEYYVDLTGLGAYHGHSVVLYRAPTISVYVEEGLLSDAGIVDLTPLQTQFGDFDIGWSFGGNNSCSAVGVDSVTVRIYRLQGSVAEDILDDEFTVACVDEPQLRTTFVPADYDVVVEGYDDLNQLWSGYVTVDLGPDTLADVTVQTELMP